MGPELISLIGFKSSGKTTLGQLLAQTLSVKWIDTDKALESKYQKTVKAIYALHQEQRFRLLESEMIQSIPIEPCVISTGGGVVLSSKGMDFLQKHSKIIYLKVDYDVILARMQDKPLFAVHEDLYQLYQKRQKLYEQYVHHVIDVSNDSLEIALEKLMRVCHGK